MIPVSLTIQGLYSYQQKQTIDFTRLTEANIFGIFGPVGSGKSTILEAMTFALYGKTDRLNLSGDNRNYNMMNLKSGDLLIELIFRAGKDDSLYMSTVKGRRNSKNFDDVRTLDRAAYIMEGKNWRPVEVDSIEKIIGLSYENFKRTVIIPQGRFQEFLQLGNSDRTKMMKELFGLEKYEMFYKVVSLESANNHQLQNIEGQLQVIGEVDENSVKTLRTELESITREIDSKNSLLANLHKEEENFRRLQDLITKKENLSKIVFDLKSRSEEFSLLEKKIEQIEFCLINFSNLIESQKEASGKITSLEQNIASDKEQLKETEERLSSLEKNFVTVEKAYQQREMLKQQADDLEKVIAIKAINEQAVILQKRIKEAQSDFGKALVTIEKLTDFQKRLLGDVSGARANIPDIKRLSEAKNWYNSFSTLEMGINEISNEMDSVLNDLVETDKKKGELLALECFSGLSSSSAPNDLEHAILKRKEQLRMLLKELDNQIQHLKVQSRLEEYSSGLEDGKPCPLCGSFDHPHPMNPKNVTDGINVLQKSREETESDILSLDRIHKLVSELAVAYGLNKVQLGRVQLKYTTQKERIETHKKSYLWPEFADAKSVEEAFVRVEELQSAIKSKEAELESVSSELSRESRRKEDLSGTLEKLRQTLASYNAEFSLLSSQIKIVSPDTLEQTTSDQIQKQKQDLLSKYNEIEVLWKEGNDNLALLHKNLDINRYRIEANSDFLEKERVRKDTVDLRIKVQLDKSGYADISEVESVLKEQFELEKEKKRLSDFKQNVALSEKQLALILSDLGGREYDDKKHEETIGRIKDMAEEVKAKTEYQGQMKKDIVETGERLELYKNLTGRANRLKLRAEEIRTLKQLFKGSGFVNYISSVYLQELCHAANERFYKLTKQCLSLEVAADNSFQVRDFINEGKVRSVKTLSGGQTFQAALSLALALADNIRKITESGQNFFFLDEGFGMLDKESLNIVFDTLKSLRKENRIVGVISHVEEMQQEIDVYLEITNDAEKGSLIKSSLKTC